MKTFKHKKTGEIATYKDGILKSSGFSVEIGVEPSSNFWEEFVEKDYEILSFIDISKLIKKEDGLFYRENTQNKGVREDQISHFRINSVLRKSDNCVFTIGDKITGKSQYNCTINSIELNPNCPQIMFNRLDEGIDLINAKHIKKPIFKTNDGVDIFEGDRVYSVTPSFCIGYSSSLKYKPIQPCFSTKEKAKEFILMNKPCLSINDINAYCNLSLFTLKELVKSKL